VLGEAEDVWSRALGRRPQVEESFALAGIAFDATFAWAPDRRDLREHIAELLLEQAADLTSARARDGATTSSRGSACTSRSAPNVSPAGGAQRHGALGVRQRGGAVAALPRQRLLGGRQPARDRPGVIAAALMCSARISGFTSLEPRRQAVPQRAVLVGERAVGRLAQDRMPKRQLALAGDA
jgi:hypothetical protein